MKILVVEDLKAVRLQLVEALTAIPEVDVVWDGPHHPEVSRAAYETQPDVVIMNILVTQAEQGRLAREAVEKIKHLNPRPLIIMLGDRQDTAYDEIYEREVMKWGVDLYLDRSHEVEKLPQLVTELLNSRHNA